MSQLNTLSQALANREAHPKMSKRYRVITTADIIDELSKQGFAVERVTGPRRKGAGPYGQHLVTLRHPDMLPITINGVKHIPQVILRNSYDGSARYGIIAGCFRSACFNGLILGKGYATQFRHVGDAQQLAFEVTKNAFDLVASGIKILQRFSEITLTEEQKRKIIVDVIKLRFGEKSAAYLTRMVLIENLRAMAQPWRSEDTDTGNLYVLYNILQEKLLRAPVGRLQLIRDVTTDDDSQFVFEPMRPRSVTRASETIRLNQGLFDIVSKAVGL